MIDTSKKTEFVKKFKETVGQDAESYHKGKMYNEFAGILKKNPDLRTLFYEAWDEAKTAESEPAAGLSALFPFGT
ncbi:hypothetical protein KAR91_21780 [Candidatus Pacearchaeota archaeon]|nr:hypothetical protein [Candidatus Pacearchaeota archaeon]